MFVPLLVSVAETFDYRGIVFFFFYLLLKISEEELTEKDSINSCSLEVFS